MNILKLTKPMMYGPAVMRIQEFLDVTVQDGIFGRKTEQAVKKYQKNNGLVVDGIVGPKTLAAIKGKLVKDPFGIVDIRGTHPRPKNYARKRKWVSIVGVTLHQTGCNMPSDPLNCGRLNAHYLVLRSGITVWVNDETDFIWHAQGLSSKTVGIEFEGNFYGVSGDPSTLWKGGGPGVRLNREQLIASRILFDHLYLQFQKNSAQWTRINGHRQSSNTRVADPGSDIWKQVALPWASKLGLKNADGGDSFKLGSGSPIPKPWDSRRTTRYR